MAYGGDNYRAAMRSYLTCEPCRKSRAPKAAVETALEKLRKKKPAG
jgi:hypothetical protein